MRLAVIDKTIFGERASLITPPDLMELQEFYHSATGNWVQRLLTDHINDLWGDVSGLDVAALGYPIPFVSQYLNQAQRLTILMPARQGVAAWPTMVDGLDLPTVGSPDEHVTRGNVVALVNEDMIPLRDGSLDRLLLIHALEAGERTRDILREAWRCLKPEGQMIVVIPNRRGVWARFDHTPFGHGRPYSRGQLERQLRSSMFEPEAWINALHMPPFGSGMIVRSARIWERLGTRISPAFSGLILVNSVKQLYAPISKGTAVRVKAGMKPVPSGAAVAGRGGMGSRR